MLGRRARGGDLPFHFRRKTRTAPPGIRVGLVPAHVLHGLVEREIFGAPVAPTCPRAAVTTPELRRDEGRFLTPRPARVVPQARVVVPAGFDELPVGAVGDGSGVDAKWRDRDLVLRSFVVVGPRIVAGADHEVPAGNQDVGREIAVDVFVDGLLVGVSVAVGIGMGEVVHELDGGEQGLVVLVLVLHHHPVHEAPGEERISRIERGRVEHAERAVAHCSDVLARALRIEDRE